MSMIDKSMEPDFDSDNEVEEYDEEEVPNSVLEEYDEEEEYTGPGEQEVEKPTKEEYKVAKWMKKNVRTKKTKFLSHVVEYFSSNKAIDALLKSKFAEGNAALFTTREQVVEYLDVMLEHKFFHRAKKVPISIEDIRGNASKESSTSTPKPTKKEEKSKREKEKDNATATAEATDKEKAASEGENNEASATGGGDDSSKDKKEKRKRKIRLDMHPEQMFVDGSEAYVWIYDPIPIHYWIYGLILLLGAIGICLFPLWPPILRKGVYYLSIAAAGFLVFILALTVVRLIIFTIVWALTAGKLHFWIFPNLTEDVGFFASFWPLYESKYVTEKSSKSSDKRSKSKSKKQKEKDSDAEDDNGNEPVASSPLIPSNIEEIKEHDVVVDEEHKAACSTKDDDSSHSSGGYNTDEFNGNENENESSDNKYSDDSDLSGYCILEASDSPNAEVLERKPLKTKKDN